MVRNRFTKGTYNGFEVEFGKVYSNPMLSAFIPMNEAKGDKKLRVFDFDDTLVKTKSHIYIKNKDGKESIYSFMLSSAECSCLV